MSKHIDILFLLAAILLGVSLCKCLPSVEDWRADYESTWYGNPRLPVSEEKVYIVIFAIDTQTDSWLMDSLLTDVNYGFADTESKRFNECLVALEVEYVPYSVDRYELASKIKTCLDIADVRVDE